MSHILPAPFRIPPPLDPAAPAGPRDARLVLLVQPFYAKDPRASLGKHVLTPSHALTSIAAVTPPAWRVRLWDENLLQGPPPCDPFPAVVGLTVHLTFADRAYALAAWYRARGAKVVLGGLHVTSCPDEAAPHADALALGDGQATWPRILADVERGTLQPRYTAPFSAPFDEAPAPRRDLVDRRSFLTTASVIATRGCHNRCGFCWLASLPLSCPYQVRAPHKVAEEIARTNEPYVVFIDNNLGSDRAYLAALCRALRPLRRIWSAAVSVDVTDDPELVALMARAGCTGVFVGLETLNADNLREAHKRSPAPEDFASRVRVFHDQGIEVNASIVYGFDHDRLDVFERTVDWLETNRLECATFHILTPYPGTPLYRQFEREGRLLHTDWSRYDTAHVVFRPRHMTPEELEAGYAWSYRRLFSHASIWRRRPAEAGAVLPYLAMSYLYKKSNPLWRVLIRHRLTHAAWRPIVALARRRHPASAP